MTIRLEQGVGDDSVSYFVAELEPFEFKEEQLIADLRRTLLDSLLQVLVLGFRRVRGVKQPGVAADAPQGVVNYFEFCERLKHVRSRQRFWIPKQRSNPLGKLIRAGAAILQACLDRWIIVSCIEVVQVPFYTACAVRIHL